VVVAGLAGVSEEYVSQIERGLKTPTITVLHRFARILGVPVGANRMSSRTGLFIRSRRR
jgi:transcriptional regulator with XRE-family HTH domain